MCINVCVLENLHDVGYLLGWLFIGLGKLILNGIDGSSLSNRSNQGVASSVKIKG